MYCARYLVNLKDPGVIHPFCRDMDGGKEGAIGHAGCVKERELERVEAARRAKRDARQAKEDARKAKIRAIEEWREGWERKMDNAIGAYELSQFEKQMAREERKLPSEKEIGPEDLGLHFLVAHPDRPERRECEWPGADVRHKDAKGDCALLLATQHGHTEIVRNLLESGARIHDSQNRILETPYIFARHHNWDDITALLDVGQLHYDFHHFVSIGNVEGVERCLDEGADQYFLYKDDLEDDNTAMHRAGLRGKAAVIELLIRHGALFHRRNRHVFFTNPFFLPLFILRSLNI